MFTHCPVLIILWAMDELRNQTTDEGPGPDFMSGMADDLEYIPRNERLGRAGRSKRKQNKKWLLLTASGAVVLIVVWAMAFDREKPAPEIQNALKANFDRIEARLNELEDKIAYFEERMNSDLPGKKGATAGAKLQRDYHIVSTGDSLSEIATKYGLTVDMLCRLNRIKVDEPIKPGQKLLISPN